MSPSSAERDQSDTTPFTIQVDNAYSAPQPIAADSSVQTTLKKSEDKVKWEVGLCDCFDSCGNACFALILPCFAAGGSVNRVGGTATVTCFMLLIASVTSIVCYILYDNSAADHDRYYYSYYNYSDDRNNTYLAAAIALTLVYATVLAVVRQRVRMFYRIHGDCCGDCCVTLFCTCCVVAQMRTHTIRAKTAEVARATLPAYQS